MRVLVGNDARVTSPPFVDDNEDVAETASTPTLTITDAVGASQPAVTPTAAETGYYHGVLLGASHTANVDLLDLVWTGTVSGRARRLTQRVEVVGGHYAPIPDLVATVGEGFDTDSVRAARDRFADIAEQYTGVAYVRRVSVVTATGCGRSTLLLPVRQLHAVRSITVNGTALDVADVTVDPIGEIGYRLGFDRPITPGPNIEAVVEHGLDAPPAPIVEACRLFVDAVLSREGSNLGRDALWSVQDGITMRLASSNWAERRPTGILGVDELLNAVPFRRAPGIA